MAASTEASIASTLDRSTLVAVQTPQAFRSAALRAAHGQAGSATDDCGARRGLRRSSRRRRRGSPQPEDHRARRSGLGPSRTGRRGRRMSEPFPDIRVGQGFDIHRFSDDPERRLVLGGFVFDGERGLVGHSDADVIAHACADALLGAAGLGDIGEHFPDTDRTVGRRRLDRDVAPRRVPARPTTRGRSSTSTVPWCASGRSWRLHEQRCSTP